MELNISYDTVIFVTFYISHKKQQKQKQTTTNNEQHNKWEMPNIKWLHKNRYSRKGKQSNAQLQLICHDTIDDNTVIYVIMIGNVSIFCGLAFVLYWVGV